MEKVAGQTQGDTVSHWFTRYRCFLPDLAGFSGSNCTAPQGLRSSAVSRWSGESGIRTHGGVTPTHAFQACSLNHSDISPLEPSDSTIGFAGKFSKHG